MHLSRGILTLLLLIRWAVGFPRVIKERSRNRLRLGNAYSVRSSLDNVDWKENIPSSWQKLVLESSFQRDNFHIGKSDSREASSEASTRGRLINGDLHAKNVKPLNHRKAESISSNKQLNLSSIRGKRPVKRISTISTYNELKKKKKRVKRIVFLPDTRIRINTSTMSQRFPFSASVKVSTGCSGSLISRYHVLTAAHCIHNGTIYITTTGSLRVGLLKRNGKYRWYKVISYHIPHEWISNHGARYDYAVLKLHKSVKRKYFGIGVASGPIPVNIHFTSFPGDKKSNTMWYSACKAKILRHIILSRCDATKGSSGAGLYVNDRTDNRVIVGVMSGSVAKRLSNGKIAYFNAGFRITKQSAKKICRWAGSPTGCLKQRV